MLIMPDNIQKPKVFFLGACEVGDCLRSIPDNILSKFEFVPPDAHLWEEHENIEDFSSLQPIANTTLGSIYAEPGPVAAQFDEWTRKLQRDKKQKLGIPYVRAYKEIVKFPLLDFYRKNAGPNDIFIFSFSLELTTKFFRNKECFTLIDDIKTIYKGVDWLEKLIDNEANLLNFDESETSGAKGDYIEQFAKDISEIFKDRVIMLESLPVNNFLLNQDTLEKIIIKRTDFAIPFFKSKNKVQDINSFDSPRRFLKAAYFIFKKKYPYSIPTIQIDVDNCYVDPSHKYGMHPWHWHQLTKTRIGNQLAEKLESLAQPKTT